MSSSDATFSMQAYKTNVLIWGMFMTSSMKAAFHLGPNYLSNSEVYKNTKFEEIDSFFTITRKLVNAWSIHHRPGRDQHYLMIKRSNGRKQKVC